jgi:hypothetical protein
MESESLDDFLDSLGKKPVMQADWEKRGTPELIGELVPEPVHVITNAAETVVEKTISAVKNNLAIDVFPDAPKPVSVGTPTTNEQQCRNIGIIAYSLTIQGIAVTAEEIYKAWPTSGDLYKLQRAGKRPSISAIQVYLGKQEFLKDMANRGVEFSTDPGGLTDEQVAFLNIVTDTTIKSGLNARIRKAGITSATFRAWKRQPAFSEAWSRLVQMEMDDAPKIIDTQLVAMASNGDLNAIKYYNDLVGRGPNDKKAVDAMQFSKIVLEAVMKHVNPEQLKAISAEIELASKAINP